MQAIRSLFAFRTAEHRNWFFVAMFLLFGSICLVPFLEPKNAARFAEFASKVLGFLHFAMTLGALYDTRLGYRTEGPGGMSVDCISFNGAMTVVYIGLFKLSQ